MRGAVCRSSLSPQPPPSPSQAVVAVATTSGCPHCKRVKDALSSNGFDFVAVNMSDRPAAALIELKRLTGRGTVPQVFVGGALVGGADETIALMNDGSLRRMVEEAALRGSFDYERGIFEILFAVQETMAATNDFIDELMRLRKRRKEGEHPVPGDQKLLEYRVVVPGAPSEGRASTESPSYVWSEDVPMVDREAFEKYGKSRPLNGHLAAFACRGAGTNPPRVRPSSTPLSSSSAPSPPSSDPVVVSARLRTLLLALYDTHMTDDGAAVDYAGLRGDPRFRAYVDLAAALDDVNLSLLDTKESKLAFWINTYNSLIVHALAVVGPAENTLQRLTWFGRVAYRIGGHVFSADDIEHGILRGNASPPASILNLIGLKTLASRLSPAFPPSDPRRAYALRTHEVDPRIHFALNCGAKSCPAIKVYSPDILEEGLRGATEAFCGEEIRVCAGDEEASKRGTETDGAPLVIEMSSILKWYGGDFGTTQHARLRYLMPYLAEADRALLEGHGTDDRALDEIRVVYRPYDWGLNSSK